MNFEESINKLKEWCELSNGNPISIGEDNVCLFKTIKLHTDQEIDEAERKLSFHFPDEYRYFLKEIGASYVFEDPEYGGGVEFYSLENVIETHEELRNMDEEEPIIDLFCMIGHSNVLGDFVGFTINKKDIRNFDVYCHEYPVFEYVNTSNEIKSWRTFDSWFIKLVDTLGNEQL